MVFALWDISDRTICSWCAEQPISGLVYRWLFDTFGHWGPRAVFLLIGAFLTVILFIDEQVEMEGEVPRRSWIRHAVLLPLLVLVLSFLTFIVAGPLLNNSRIDATIEHWREKYFSTVAFASIAIFCLYTLWLDFQDYRETGEPIRLFRILVYSALAIAGGVLFALGF